ncbi:tetratricopeptide repeat protein [Bradyrhizobium sp.]|uniref:tetratricopeptide repeat protein n=1 Tax=Bradyrhizobium sp. TaxID=376 RepID=UPI003C6F3DC5
MNPQAPEDQRQRADAINAALVALREGRIEQAGTLAQTLLQDAPDDPAAHQLVATIAWQRGDHDQTLRWARSCLALQPRHAPALLLAGRAARAAGDLGGALQFFREAAQCVPERADAAFMTCITLLELGDPKANDSLHDLLRRFPGDADGWHDIGMTLHRAGKFEAALVAFTRAAAMAQNPRHEMARAASLQALGRLGEAVDVLRQAGSLLPGNADIVLHLALCLHKLGELAAARVALEPILASNPASANLWFAYGLICQDSRDPVTAITAYRRTLDLSPELAEAHVNLGICLQQTGDIAAAKAAFGRAMRLRADTFGRIAQALSAAPRGELWLDPERLRQSFAG